MADQIEVVRCDFSMLLLTLQRSCNRTPAWVASRLGTSRSTVQRWVDGGQPLHPYGDAVIRLAARELRIPEADVRTSYRVA